mmetsp:Transcript_11417/g.18925  ORF Transcript_11417/g.18925 Transcript_11417/m.18925 type:complete len:95 (+) Transcript_11417:77-361(+)
MLHMSSALPDYLPPNPSTLIFAIAVTISLFPLIDLCTVGAHLFDRPLFSKRRTTHRDLLLLYFAIIIASFGLFPLWFYFCGGASDNTILKSWWG